MSYYRPLGITPKTDYPRPIAVLVGRTNVGKSSLFNKLTETQRAIVHVEAGTTRDRLRGTCRWRGRELTLIDTAGADHGRSEALADLMNAQTQRALEEADVVVFVGDAKVGITAADREVFQKLRSVGKPLIIAVNKVDGHRDRSKVDEFLAFGTGEVHPVSAKNGAGTGDLLDAVLTAHGEDLAELPEDARATAAFEGDGDEDSKASESGPEKPTRIAIVGQPNVGKSSLVNALLGHQAVIVSDLPHTTRQPQDLEFAIGNTRYTLVDTAGLRKKRKVFEPLQVIGMRRSLAALKKADVALLVISAESQLGNLEQAVAEDAETAGVSLIVVVNKWDLAHAGSRWGSPHEYEDYLRKTVPYLWWVPVITISATHSTRLDQLVNLIEKISVSRRKVLTHGEVEKFFHNFHRINPPPTTPQSGKKFFLYELKQLGSNPPRFELVTNQKEKLPAYYQRAMLKAIREQFGFTATPVKLAVRSVRD